MSSTLTKKQIEWAYKKWCEGYTQGEISEALYVSQNTVYRALKGKSRMRPKLAYDFTKENEEVKCKDCKFLMFSDCYGECSQGHEGIVQPDDSCGHGVRKENDNG